MSFEIIARQAIRIVNANGIFYIYTMVCQWHTYVKSVDKIFGNQDGQNSRDGP